MKFIFTHCGQNWIKILQSATIFVLFVEGILRISDKFYLFISILLIPDLSVRPMMTCLWRHYLFHDVLWHLNKNENLPYKVHYDVLSQDAWVSS